MIIKLASNYFFLFSLGLLEKVLFLNFFPWHKMYKKKIQEIMNYEEKQTEKFRVTGRLIIYFSVAVSFFVWNISTDMEQLLSI